METTATVAVIGMAVLVASSLVAVYPRTMERLEAHEELLLALEATCEGLRSGAIALADGPVEPVVESRRPLQLELEVVASATPDLYEITATGRTTVRGREVVRALHTRIWRPR